MSKMIMIMAVLVLSTVAQAQDFGNDETAFCDGEASFDNVAAVYNIKEGRFVPEVMDRFCANYQITGSTHYPCNGNIRSFILSCDTNRKWAFICAQGFCTTVDKARDIRVTAGCTERVRYRTADQYADLVYDGPCQ